MDLGLKDKVALVTGSSKGIGKEIARKFLLEGCMVVISGHNQENLDKAKAELSQFGRCEAVVCDVSVKDDVIRMMERTEEVFGTLDILINNAGELRPKLIENMEEEEWDSSINVNLKSIFLCSKYGYSIMKKEKSGVIINASSFAAVIPSVSHAGYASAKSGVLSFTKVAAAEFAPSNVRVLAYIPGVVATHLTEAMRADEKKADKMLRDIPLHRFAKPEEVASMVVFLASKEAEYVSGCAIHIDGGKLCVQNPADAYI